MRLTTKIILLFLTLTVVPLVVVGYLAYDNGRRTIEQNMAHHLMSTTLYKENELQRWIEHNVQFVASLAQRPLIREYTAVLLTHDAASPEFQAAYERLMADHLLPNLTPSGFLNLVILRGDDGLALIATEPLLEGKYRESEYYFLQGRQGTYVDSVRYFISHGQAAMHISTPIRDRDGNTLGVLVGHADLDEMSKIMLQGSGSSPSEETYLVNDFNFFVTEPRLAGEDYALKKALYTEGVQACLAGANGVGHYEDYRGVPIVGAYRWIPERSLCILTEVDEAEAYAPVVELGKTILTIGLGLMLAVALFGVVFARTITLPLERLVEGAREIGSGNLEHRIRIETGDEIGQLARAFNDMTANLRQSLEETAHNKRMLLALSQAAQAVQRVHIPDQIHDTVGNEITALGYHAIVYQLAADGEHLSVAHLTFEPELLRTPEKPTGISAEGHRVALKPGGIYERVLRGREAIFAEGMADVVESSPERLTGLPGFEEAIYAPLTTGEGEALGLLVVVGKGLSEADVPAVTTFANQTATALENARLYEKVRRYAAQLEQRVAERTEQLDQARLAALDMMEEAQEARRQAERINKELEYSNRELEQFAYVASHDLQEPLRAISGYLQFLQRRYGDQIDEKADMFINRSVAAAERMKTMINDLLAFSRVKTRGKPFEPTDLSSVLEKTEANLQTAIQESNATITVDPLPVVMADSSQMVQLFQNLISNGIKFRGEDPPRIHIAAARDGGDGDWHISVEDNGIGIEPRYDERIFIIFQRLHTRDEYPGTGIGLAICKKIVERHGGRIWVESETDEGSTFHLTISDQKGETT